MRVLSLLSLLACACTGAVEPTETGDSGPVTPAEEAEACRLAAEPGRRLTAGETPDTTAPALAVATEPNTITIVPDRANYVRVEAGAPGTLVLFAGVEDVFVHVVQGTEPLAAEPPVAVEGCSTAIPERHDIPLPEAGAYHLRIAWAGFSELWVYAELL